MNLKPGNNTVKAALRGILIGFALAVVFMAGFLFRGTMPLVAAGATQNSEVGSYPLLTEAQKLLNDHYLRTQPDQRQLEYGAIRGLISSLQDKYTFFIDPPVSRSESDVLAGKYGGIGVQVKRDEQNNFVLFPFPNGPAARAGVKDGDLLLKVNGKDVPHDTAADAADQLLRGEVKDDNGVKIAIKRPASQNGSSTSSDEQLEFTIPFEVIEVPSVVWRVLTEEPTFGYMQILRFTNRTPDEVKAAFNDLKSKNIRALILDMRNNPGGLLAESIKVAGQFLEGGVVLYERSRDGEKTLEADKADYLVNVPMIVIVNQGTASAAELVAGAIQDRKRGSLIGQQTYGKGSVQLIFALADKSSLHVTTAEWLTPNKTLLDGKGLVPDIPMIPDPNGRDVELGEAIRRLRNTKM
jgi:carboxyl-terminal processing protease